MEIKIKIKIKIKGWATRHETEEWASFAALLFWVNVRLLTRGQEREYP